MECRKCKTQSVKNGKVKSNKKQRFYCKICRESFLYEYSNHACELGVKNTIVRLLREGCGTLSISRLICVSSNTVTKNILEIAGKIQIPPIILGRTYELDEMFTYIGNKERRICIAYAIDRETRNVVSYAVGRRNRTTLRMVVNTLLLSETSQIRTDKCPLYPLLIPHEIHHVKQRGINYIERKNLTLRTHLKRLNRKTLGYSKSILVLNAVLRIYFWGDMK